MNIAVLGSGSWATAIVKIATQTHTKVYWWVREQEIVQAVESFGHNPLYLRSCELDRERIIVSSDLKMIVSKATDIILVIPAAFVAGSLQSLCPKDFEGKRIICATKGIIPQTNQIVADYIRDYFNVRDENQAVISGPSHAEEIAQERLTYLTVGSCNDEFAKQVAEGLKCRFVKTTTSSDIRGIEYGAVMKNIYALAAGIARGAGYGDNFVAVLIANAAQEMGAFLAVAAPQERDTNRFVYLGDLLVTAYSQHSRNRTFGQMIGQGYSVKSAQLEMAMVAEGYYAAECIDKANRSIGVSLPIARAVYEILYKGKSADEEFKRLSELFK
ncbi:MAG: NAD(P)H-dependent glycerol-3-phosphate dehydrogenase [Candidatus Onthomorpha sp.]|nr:NAD(P)H-dependent glycerol-3-phosphate dehydrogenase [Bacteroidales bacterium]MCI7701202.1 NAD(P)H-dependent glycerol-3-phosphate dehydrogenase [Bacteroidales bacterium]MDD7589897.1 NAD(P)H-dependent glycerol-3-phosphate dehydrogenase [Bacteroidales bacterium]MDY5737387.1 NAD(P)H-dependent glycerol-3-phosphate dehydrogenase [Candidatus Onthomorpha sp.]MDY5826378.1 NAD(P)H-dependent glycerol-3-phosphate dehydrogenase [Candidatus Onthomorpha sp.]